VYAPIRLSASPATYENAPAPSKAEVSYDRKARLSLQEPGFYESNPQKSMAAARSGREVYKPIRLSAPPAIYENAPIQSPAEVSYDRQARLFLPGPQFFESTPQRSTAAARSGKEVYAPIRLSASPAIYENAPEPSPAEVSYDRKVPSSLAEPGFYESKPQKSTAAARSGREVYAPIRLSASPATYENAPAPSKAEVSYDRKARLSLQEPGFYESNPQKSMAAARWEKEVYAPTRLSATPAIYENAPVPSSAEASYGRRARWSMPELHGSGEEMAAPIASSVFLAFEGTPTSSQVGTSYDQQSRYLSEQGGSHRAPAERSLFRRFSAKIKAAARFGKATLAPRNGTPELSTGFASHSTTAASLQEDEAGIAEFRSRAEDASTTSMFGSAGK